MIFGGAMVDALWGYRAFMALTPGETAQEAERLANSTNLQLPFAIRCEDTGQENYPDGSPKRWWSRLVVLDHGKEVLKKEIAVNDPLTYRGVRFFQAGYGSTGQAREVTLVATRKDRGGERRLALVPGVPTPLDDHGATVTLVAFVPDFIVRGNQIITASEKPTNPAIELLVEEPKRGPRSTSAGAPVTVRLFPARDPFPPPNPSSYRFLYQGVEMIPYTGLQLAHEPGQWLIWAGCIILTLGLALAFYFVHIRFWALPIYGESAVADRTIPDDRGQLAPSRSLGAGLTMWLGGSASKNREDFEIRFRELVNEVRHALS
jgi:cytochrome c biogenesis protein